MILIALKGGLVQSVYSDDPALVDQEVRILDYDTEGGDDAYLVLPDEDEGADLRYAVVAPLSAETRGFILG